MTHIVSDIFEEIEKDSSLDKTKNIREALEKISVTMETLQKGDFVNIHGSDVVAITNALLEISIKLPESVGFGKESEDVEVITKIKAQAEAFSKQFEQEATEDCLKVFSAHVLGAVTKLETVVSFHKSTYAEAAEQFNEDALALMNGQKTDKQKSVESFVSSVRDNAYLGLCEHTSFCMKIVIACGHALKNASETFKNFSKEGAFYGGLVSGAVVETIPFIGPIVALPVALNGSVSGTAIGGGLGFFGGALCGLWEAGSAALAGIKNLSDPNKRAEVNKAYGILVKTNFEVLQVYSIDKALEQRQKTKKENNINKSQGQGRGT